MQSKVIITIALFSFLNLLFANNIPKIYFQNLPEKLTIDNPSNEMIAEVSQLAELNPDLIYYFLRFAKTKNFMTKDSLEKTINYSKYQKRQWIQSLKSVIRQQIADSLYLNEIFLKLDPWSPEPDSFLPEPIFHKNSYQNEIDYLVLKYYNIPQDNETEIDERHFLSSIGLYNKNANYHPYRKRIENQKRNALIARLSLNKNFENIKQIINHYYLFTDSIQKLKAHQLIMDLLQKQIPNHTAAARTSFRLGAGYQYINYNPIFYESNTLDFTKISMRLRRSSPYHSLTLGWQFIYSPKRFVLKSNLNLNPYWYLKIGAYLFLNKNYSSNFSGQIEKKYSIAEKDYSEIMNLDGTYKAINSWGLGTSFSIPILARKNIFGVEIGLMYLLLFTKYEIAYEYKFKKLVGYLSGSPGYEFYQYHLLDERSDTINVQKNLRNNFVFPTVQFYIYALKSLKINFLTGGIKLFKVSVLYSI